MRTMGDPEIAYPLTAREWDYIHARLVADGVRAVRGFRYECPLVTVYANRWDGKGDVSLTYDVSPAYPVPAMPQPESHIHIHINGDAPVTTTRGLAEDIRAELMRLLRRGINLGVH